MSIRTTLKDLGATLATLDTCLRELEVIFSTDNISNSKKGKDMPTSSILHDLQPEARDALLAIGTQDAENFDPVNRPQHYNEGKIECIDAIESACTGLTGFEGLCTGTAIKYIWRWKKKEKPVQDIRKAIWYLERLLKHLGEKEEE